MELALTLIQAITAPVACKPLLECSHGILNRYNAFLGFGLASTRKTNTCDRGVQGFGSNKIVIPLAEKTSNNNGKSLCHMHMISRQEATR